MPDLSLNSPNLTASISCRRRMRASIFSSLTAMALGRFSEDECATMRVRLTRARVERAEVVNEGLACVAHLIQWAAAIAFRFKKASWLAAVGS